MKQLDSSAAGATTTVINYILEKIKSENLKPGSKLNSERQLAKDLGVSRSSVREAIERLTALGYLETRERVGTFVSSKYLENEQSKKSTMDLIQLAPIIDLMEVRMLLESNFIPIIIEKYNEKDIIKLKEILEKLKIKFNSLNYDPLELHEIDLEFHFALAKATHNVVIIELMKVILNRIKANKKYFIESSKETIHKDIKIFEQIINNIEDGNTEKAVELYNEHLGLVMDVLKGEN